MAVLIYTVKSDGLPIDFIGTQLPIDFIGTHRKQKTPKSLSGLGVSALIELL